MKAFLIICMTGSISFGQILDRTTNQLYEANKTLEIKTKSDDMLWVKDGQYNFIMSFKNDSCYSYGLEIPIYKDLYNKTYHDLHDCGKGDLRNLSLPFGGGPRFCWIYKCNEVTFYLWDCDMEGKTGDKAFIYVVK